MKHNRDTPGSAYPYRIQYILCIFFQNEEDEFTRMKKDIDKLKFSIFPRGYFNTTQVRQQ